MRLLILLYTEKPIRAPAHARSFLNFMIEKYELERKYGKQARHLDYVFERSICPIHNRREISLEKTVRGAFNRWFSFFNHSYRIVTACTVEENVQMDTICKNINNRKTLINYEFIIPETEIHVLVETDDQYIINMFYKSKNSIIYLGGWRKYGYGRTRVKDIVRLPDK